MRIAVLTPEENKAWENYFAFYIANNYSDEAADKHAWDDVCEEFPRLKEFDGCK